MLGRSLLNKDICTFAVRFDRQRKVTQGESAEPGAPLFGLVVRSVILPTDLCRSCLMLKSSDSYSCILAGSATKQARSASGREIPAG